MNPVTIEVAVQALIQILSNAMDLASKIQTAHQNGAAGLTDTDVTDFAQKYADAKAQVDTWLTPQAASSSSTSTPPTSQATP